jgi:hypothetical protein
MKKLLVLLLTLSLISPTIYAKEGGDRVGNGDDDPVLSLSPEQVQVLEAGTNLDYLKLDGKAITARDKRLAPIYASYMNNNVARVVNAIENDFGLNVYNDNVDERLSFNKAKRIDKDLVMKAAVRFFLQNSNYSSPLREAPETELGFRDSVRVRNQQEVTMVKKTGRDSQFQDSYRIRPDFALITDTRIRDNFLSNPKALYTTTENKLFTMPGILTILEALQESNLRAIDATLVITTGGFEPTNITHTTCTDTQLNTTVLGISDNGYVYRFSGYAGLANSHEDQFVSELNKLTNGTNDITIGEYIFSNNQILDKKEAQAYTTQNLTELTHFNKFYKTDITQRTCEYKVETIPRNYQVVYPSFSRLAPIPQPVIYLNMNASKEEILEMLAEHAPRIYAYNNAFERQVLPQVKDLNALLAKHPNFLADVQKQAGKVSNYNIGQALQQAFLTLSIGAGATVTLAAMLASPFYYPILVKTTVLIIL